jgi:hydrogenase maturation protease
MKRIVVIGIGNSGRGDDGLGWKFAERVEELFHDRCDVEYRYQLQVEDAQLIEPYEAIIFADATQEAHEGGFSFVPCEPSQDYFFSTHIQSPGAILSLANFLYGKTADAFLLSISGVEWGMKLFLSETASANLEASLRFFETWLRQREALSPVTPTERRGSFQNEVAETKC